MYLVNCMYLNPGDIVNGRYKVISKLGKGGFGTTYSAYDNQQSPPLIVVLKQIRIIQSENNEAERDNDYIRRLRLEADTLRNLQHPCIPKFFDSFEEDKYYYIVQEYIEGDELSKEILPGEPIGEEEAESILRQILEILQFVHENNIIHRDVKPANIIRRKINGKLYLIDFGAVKEIVTEHTNASGMHLTRAIVSMGYTPPEQLDGKPKLNSDIYALGMMLMRAVTGFSINAICDEQSVLQRDHDSLNYIWQDHAPQISLTTKEIISKMIKYNFNNRYKTIEEILKDLDADREQDTEQDQKPVPEIDSTRIIYDNFPRKNLKFIIVLTLASLLSFILLKKSGGNIYQVFLLGNICSKINDNISCGEEILDPLSKGSIRVKAAQEYRDKKYQDALEDYRLSWQKERRDAESLIYLNNTLLEASKADYYTIAIAVPLSSNETANIHNSDLAQNFLRGIAQSQSEVNLSLIDAGYQNFEKLPGHGILDPKNISSHSARGLKVIIFDDGNNVEQAQQVAKKIAKVPKILGIVGHYASEMSLATVDIYQQNNIPQISFGTTTKRLSTNHRKNFFRSVYTNVEEAATMAKYIKSIELEKKKVTVFYNPKSDFSNYLWIELKDQLKKLNIPVVKEFDIANDKFNTQTALNEANRKEANIYVVLPDGQVTNALSNAIQVIQQDNGNSFIVGGNSLIVPRVKRLSTNNLLNITASVFWDPLSSTNLKFVEQSKQFWQVDQVDIENDIAVSYDASLALIEAIKLQAKPSRKGTIEQLSNPEFLVKEGATGSIKFNTPENGDRLNFYPTLVRLHKCQDGSNHFVTLSLDDAQASDLVCQSE